MPGRVHAIVVVRPDGHTPSAYHLRRTVTALAAQTRRPDEVTIVVCGSDPAVEDAITGGELPICTASGRPTRAVRAPARTRFAAATIAVARETDADTLWLLAQDTTPEPSALERLGGQLELSASLTAVAPKLVRIDDDRRIVSLGASLTRSNRAVELAAGDLDQGQLDMTTDVLGFDIRGVLVDTAAFRALGGIDPALRGADEGLDLAIALRLRGDRVALVPGVRVGVDGDGVAGLPFIESGGERRRALRLQRTAHLHRLLVMSNPLLLVPLWILLPLLALVRSAAQLVTKDPERIIPEWVATIVAMARLRAIARARRRMRRGKRVPWSRLDSLRVSAATARERNQETEDPRAIMRGELRFFSGGGAWLVLAMAVVSLAAFPALLAWPALGGGALEPLRSTVSQLWIDAAYGLRPTGWNVTDPADPFSALIAIIGSLWPFSPSRALVLLWLAALPLAALGGWFAATRITERPMLRIVGGIAWALAPTFLVALVEGIPTAVIVHLLLPWLVFAGAAAQRSWVPAAVASIVAACVVAAAPALAPALAIVLLISLIGAIIRRSGGAVLRMLWLAVPAAALFFPLAIVQGLAGNWWGLLADPGASIPRATPATDAADRWGILLGFPAGSTAGWSGLVPDLILPWLPILLVPLALLALAAATTPRWPVGAAHLGIIILGVGTGIAAAHIVVRFTGAEGLAIWPGGGLSLAWWGVVGAATLTLDQLARALRQRAPGTSPTAVTALAVVSLAALVVLAVPALSAVARGTSALTNGPVSTLPAYVAAEGTQGAQVGTLVLTPQADGSLAVRVVWGESDTIGAESTILETRTSMDVPSQQLAEVAASFVSESTPDAVTTAAAQGIGFVLLSPGASGDSLEAAGLRLEAATSLDQRDELDAVGETEKGALWRITVDVAARPQTAAPLWGAAVTGIQLVVFAVALLLAIPTRRTRSRARRWPRVVGLTRAERDEVLSLPAREQAAPAVPEPEAEESE
ncbi:hypothetical protein GCM10009808_02780 [Microbacterium sediminicola]|uniref:Glycosyltransferase, GT2 family n=1 Tax=Microbacterium sediminicola TaxID=415210 RepID=A0ABP4TLL7_9MICO